MATITIIGTGNVGGPLAALVQRNGHDAVALDTSSADEVAAEAISASDVVVLATPYAAVFELPEAWKTALNGAVVVDATNPLTPDFSGLTVGFETSGAEQIAQHLKGARVVKALNAVLAPNHDLTAFADGTAFVPVAGDDDVAVESVTSLLRSLGFDAVKAGSLSNARFIEPLAEVLVQLAYFQGEGTGIALALQRA